MPIYEYKCKNKLCPLYNKVQEVWKSISDSDKQEKCTAGCKGYMSKIISKNTFHLKGSGWYGSRT